MVEPVSIAVHAVQRTKIAPESTAVVVGSGMIGLLVIQALRWAGARNIVAIDLADNRLVFNKATAKIGPATREERIAPVPAGRDAPAPLG